MDLLREISALTTFLILLLSTKLRSQPLIDNVDQQCSDFHNDMKLDKMKTVLNDLENRLEKTTLQLDMALADRKSIYGNYVDLMMMYSKGETPDDETIDNICSKHPELIIKTSNDCQTYYNCSGEDPELSRWIPMYHFWPSKYKHECHYPFVFSTKSLRCENYTDVDCGSRFLPTWACRYFRNQCKLSHCIPCDVRFPNCENKSDGLWPQPSRGFSPWYMICENNRTLRTGYCPTDREWSVQSFPYKGECVHLFAIPNDYDSNGLLPSCKEKVDGNYQYKERCDAFYKCENGTASAIKCPQNTIFDSVKRSCEVGIICSK
uniref:Uncharacterized protein LOC111106095 isoform X2 n=1 Tax=Crassostrea virginica TaxID=6565 RepID=A0A8B8AZX9_CRAVI|nr:uncharacterized protein LOC111106095 isoform X2 [Crassostrea virginica]